MPAKNTGLGFNYDLIAAGVPEGTPATPAVTNLIPSGTNDGLVQVRLTDGTLATLDLSQLEETTAIESVLQALNTHISGPFTTLSNNHDQLRIDFDAHAALLHPKVARFLVAADSVVYDNDDFTLKWNAASEAFVVSNKKAEWFDSSILVLQGDNGFQRYSSDIANTVGDFFFSEDGSDQGKYQLDEVYASSAMLMVCKGDTSAPSIWAMAMRGGNTMNVLYWGEPA